LTAIGLCLVEVFSFARAEFILTQACLAASRPGGCETRIQVDSLIEQARCARQRCFLSRLAQILAAAQIEVVRFQAGGWARDYPVFRCRRQHRHNRQSDGVRDIGLHVEDIFELSIVSLGPADGPALDQGCRHANAIAIETYAAFQHVINPECRGDRRGVDAFPLEVER
jgi:hypothetical protein